MESSEVVCCSEEWSDSSGDESGWTAYICSPIHQNRQDDSFTKWELYEVESCSGCSCDDVESDDSLNSDASSGPICVQFSSKINERSASRGPSKLSRSRKKFEARTKQVEVVRPKITFEKQVSDAFQPKSASSHVKKSSKKRFL